MKEHRNEISIPMNPTPAKIKEDIQKMLELRQNIDTW